MQLFTNNAISTLSAGITAVQTSIVLASGTGAKFPVLSGGDTFTLTLFQMSGSTEVNHEIVKITARSADTLTAVRGQEGTTARAFNTGDPVSLRITAGSMNTDAVAEGATNQYFTLARVQGALLTGINLLTNAAITASDTVISALGKLQKQITDLATTVSSKANSASPTFTGTVSFPSQTQNLMFASPNGASGVPTWRALVAADIPTLNQNTTGTAANVTGIVLGANGGTGVANTGKTITLGGSLITTGAGTITFAGTASNITYTLPTVAGTLAILGANTFTARQIIPAFAFPLVDKGTVASGTVTFDASAAEVQRLQVGGALTITASNWPATTNRGYLQLKIINGGSAVITITPTINWVKPDGTFTTSIATYMTAIGRTGLQTSGTDQIIWWTDDAGTTIYGKVI